MQCNFQTISSQSSCPSSDIWGYEDYNKQVLWATEGSRKFAFGELYCNLQLMGWWRGFRRSAGNDKSVKYVYAQRAIYSYSQLWTTKLIFVLISLHKNQTTQSNEVIALSKRSRHPHFLNYYAFFLIFRITIPWILEDCR